MDLNRTIAALATIAGGALITIGVGMIFLPAGIIAGGSILAGLGLFAVDVGGERE